MNTLTDGAWTKFLSGVVALPGALDNIISRIEKILQMGGVIIAAQGSWAQTGGNNPSNPQANPPTNVQTAALNAINSARIAAGIAATPTLTSAIQSPTSYIPLTSDSKTASTGSQTVNLILDGQTVQRWVINTVTGAIA